MNIADAAARTRALDIHQSFIVQAGAGSGKTELLTQRMLKLLAHAEHPEEVIVLTFTRKATAEMRQRIVDKLTQAHAIHTGLADWPASAHARLSVELAQAVLTRDQQSAWQLLEHPARLRIMTIDALNASLVRQMPYLSHMGAGARTSDDAQKLYRDAAHASLAGLEDRLSPQHQAIATLLAHLDNDLPRLESLLADMLARRDQWLERRMPGVDQDEAEIRQHLENAYACLIETHLDRVTALLPPGCWDTLLPCARAAAAYLQEANSDSPIIALLDCNTPYTTLTQWQALAELVLTDKGNWRKKLTKTSGCPPKSAHTEALKTWLAGFDDQDPLAYALHTLRALPDRRFSPQQWDALWALFTLLKVAAAHLWLAFRARGEVDFAEIHARALHALGDDDAPTDLALALDYRIRHLLVDEFQDTSFGQYHLLQRLTQGWETGDGRTLFVVGDPMQSIYRFREADVSLFLDARQHGIGQVSLESLTLNVNFRSQAAIVAWINHAFSQVLPREDDLSCGAVAYTPSVAVHPARTEPAVILHPQLCNDSDTEAQQIAQLIRTTHAQNPDTEIAILVRSRSALGHIIPTLKQYGVRFRALNIDNLAERQCIADLLQLTRALLLPADRVAWLALLRAPWCGLNWVDLTRLVEHAPHQAMWTLLNDETRYHTLSTDGQTRVHHVRRILAATLAERGRLSFASSVERCWYALGAAVSLHVPQDQADCDRYFALLAQLERGDALDPDTLEDELKKLYAAPDSHAGPCVDIMTIHQSKGLEFDVVILPGLHRPGQNGDSRLLHWQDILDAHGNAHLLLAPIKAAGSTDDAKVATVQQLERQRDVHENGRLLYVAATRAKQQLHLLGSAKCKRDGSVNPTAGSLLHTLWPAVAAHYQRTAEALAPNDIAGDVVDADSDSTAWPYYRLPHAWFIQLTPPPEPTTEPEAQAAQTETGSSTWPQAQRLTRAVGTLTHLLLQTIAQQGLPHWDEARLTQYTPILARLFSQHGVYHAREQQEGARRVITALTRCLRDEIGRWVLAPHTDAASEWPLSERDENGHTVRHIVDRSFVDTDGIRWIIDYKVSAYSGHDLDAFLAHECERYRPQLARYHRVLAKREPRPIRCALYFVLQGRLVEMTEAR